jgi:hypothetical protein
VARAKRRKRKGRAVGFFLLAGLTLLIAGFIARREIPFLIRHGYHHPPTSINGDNAMPRTLATGGANTNHSDAAAKTRNVAAVAARDQYANGAQTAAETEEPREDLSSSDRQQLGKLIKERAR